MNKLFLFLSIIIVLIIICVGGFFGAQYYYKTNFTPDYFFGHPTLAKIFNIIPACPSGGTQVCGTNGKNYPNKCLALQSKAGYDYDGPCVPGYWQTYTNATNGIQLKYPKTFYGATWQTQTWPPSVSVVSGKISADEACANNNITAIPFTFVAMKKIGTNNFSILKNSDVGAGQLYTDYCYVLNFNGENYVLNFVIHSTNGCGNGNCGPWCGTPNEQACKNFDMQKEVEQPIEEIVSTFRLTK